VAASVRQDIVDRLDEHDEYARMPAISGVAEPLAGRWLTDSYFCLKGDQWVLQVIDDPGFPRRVLSGGQRVGWHVREQVVTRVLFDSGARVSEIVGLTLGDWEALGRSVNATAFSKGSHGRRVKELRFAADTAKLAMEIFSTTGMRINEAMQIRIARDCYVESDVPAPPGATDQRPTRKWFFRVTPKGERTSRPRDGFMDGFLSRFATYVNLGEVVVCAPEEIQQQLEAAQGRIGTLANVKGGRCVQPGFCPAKSACIGCPCKAPEPNKRADVQQERAWATAQRKWPSATDALSTCVGWSK
jgi:hypothetical protein